VKVRARLLEGDSNQLLLQVSDNGCGISEGMTEQIFERLFQASDPAQAGRQGLGLGLHICKELVLRQGGRIWATSVPGEGAVLSVTLPVFSMRNLLAPMLEATNGAPGPLMLLTAQVVSPAGWVSDAARAEHSQWARELLRRCMHSERDVLLPKMGNAGAAELFFVAVATDSVGCESLARRIRQQFDERELAQKAGLVLSTASHTVETAQQNRDNPKGASFEWVTAMFQSLVNEELSSRIAANG
jgi:hypothetical protein